MDETTTTNIEQEISEELDNTQNTDGPKTSEGLDGTQDTDGPKTSEGLDDTQDPDEPKTPKELGDKLSAALAKQKKLKAQAEKTKARIRRLQKEMDRDTLYTDTAKLIVIAYRHIKGGVQLPEELKPSIDIDEGRIAKILSTIPLKTATREKINSLIN